MAAPHLVIPRLEGIVSTIANSGFTGSPSTYANQTVSNWVKACRDIMRSHNLRDKNDWELYVSKNVIATTTTNAITAAAATVYGVLWGSIENDGAVFAVLSNAAAGTVNGTTFNAAFLSSTVLPAAASASYREYTPLVYPGGLYFSTVLEAGADGVAGADVTANDISVVVLYRS